MSTKQVYKTKVPSPKNQVFLVQDPLEWLKQIKYVGTRWGYMERLDLASYDSIGVYLQIRLRHFATQMSITLTSIAP